MEEDLYSLLSFFFNATKHFLQTHRLLRTFHTVRQASKIPEVELISS